MRVEVPLQVFVTGRWKVRIDKGSDGGDEGGYIIVVVPRGIQGIAWVDPDDVPVRFLECKEEARDEDSCDAIQENSTSEQAYRTAGWDDGRLEEIHTGM